MGSKSTGQQKEKPFTTEKKNQPKRVIFEGFLGPRDLLATVGEWVSAEGQGKKSEGICSEPLKYEKKKLEEKG